ncbi:DUF6927 domain-containing protein [Hyphococcus sp.]|uniref:DUF6927 domain-containing protein n=1 Tax=Hyphococcus sp. TaxID=2038636 RepID=UPI0035C6A63A
MGWTFTYGYDGRGVRAFLDRQFAGENEAGRWEILKSALVHMRTYYAACRWTDRKTDETRVFAIVALVKYSPRDREGLTLGWKGMDEGMGPCEAKCPLAILDLLDPPDPARDGAEWRARVRAYHARRKARPKLGDVVVFAEPLRFTDGTAGKRFRCERAGMRRRAYRNLETGGLCRISKIEERDFFVE